MRNNDLNKSFYRKHIYPVLHQYQWALIGIIALAALFLGYIGFRLHFQEKGEETSFFHSLYLTLQLFVMESGAIDQKVNIYLQVARFLAPVFPAFAAIKAALVLFEDQLQTIRTKFIRDHFVVCGLGRSGYRLVKQLLKQGEKVLIIEKEENNDMVEYSRKLGAHILVGNAAEEEILTKARLAKAEALLCVCGDDGINAEIAIQAKKILNGKRKNRLSCCVQILDPNLCRLLHEKEFPGKESGPVRLIFQNYFETGAVKWLDQYPPFDESSTIKGNTPHILLVGAGKMGEGLIIQAVQRWKSLELIKSQKLSISVMDLDARDKVSSLQLRYPGLDTFCELKPMQMDICSSDFYQKDWFSSQDPAYTTVFICLDDDTFGLLTALSLKDRMDKTKIPIIVRMTEDEGLAALVQDDNEKLMEDLHAFCLYDEAVDPALMLDSVVEKLARALHEDFVKNRTLDPSDKGMRETLVPWEQLSAEFKDSNREQAEYAIQNLEELGYTVRSNPLWDDEPIQFSKKEIEQLAKREHKRWYDEKIAAGWKYGPVRNDSKKVNPNLLDWQNPDLAKDTKNYNLETAENLVEQLTRVGLNVVRNKN